MKKFLLIYNIVLLALALSVTALSMRAVYADTAPLPNQAEAVIISHQNF